MHYTCRTTERSMHRSICISRRDHQRPVCWQWHHSRPRRCARRVGLAPGGAARFRLQRAEQGQVHILEPGVCRWQPHQPLVDFGHDGGMVACADTARASRPRARRRRWAGRQMAPILLRSAQLWYHHRLHRRRQARGKARLAWSLLAAAWQPRTGGVSGDRKAPVPQQAGRRGASCQVSDGPGEDQRHRQL